MPPKRAPAVPNLRSRHYITPKYTPYLLPAEGRAIVERALAAEVLQVAEYRPKKDIPYSACSLALYHITSAPDGISGGAGGVALSWIRAPGVEWHLSAMATFAPDDPLTRFVMSPDTPEQVLEAFFQEVSERCQT